MGASGALQQVLGCMLAAVTVTGGHTLQLPVTGDHAHPIKQRRPVAASLHQGSMHAILQAACPYGSSGQSSGSKHTPVCPQP